ncbi:MAG: tautomerase family protein [Janthinobacterium lividum]
MPHIIVKMYPAKSEAQKQQIADEVTKAIMSATGHGPDPISVAIEEVQPSDWVEAVFRPDILAKPETIYKKPGYDPL